MKARGILAFAVCFVLAAAAMAQGSTAPVFMPAAELKWMDMDPVVAPGIKITDVWGDHTKGGFGGFIKFPAGFLSPLHTHTSAIKIVVISGTYTQAAEGKPTGRFGPGSYVLQPGGSYKHISGCDAASECVIFVESDGKFDLIMAEAPKAPGSK